MLCKSPDIEQPLQNYDLSIQGLEITIEGRYIPPSQHQGTVSQHSYLIQLLHMDIALWIILHQ
jgi:hypothetical protein